MRTIIRVSQFTLLIYACITLIFGWLLPIPAFGQARNPTEPYLMTQAEPGSTATPGVDPTEMQSRGVPPQGVIVQGDQLRAAPGYVLEKGEKNKMIARQKAGGGRMLTLDCGCQGGTGFCSLEVSGDVAICHRGASNPCSGTCEWTDVPSKVGKPQFR